MANGNARSAGGPCPLNYVCACFAGNVSHPAKVRDGDNPSSCHYRVTHHRSPIDLSLLRSGGSFGEPSQGPEFGNECHRRSTNPANQFFARGCSKPSSIQI